MEVQIRDWSFKKKTVVKGSIDDLWRFRSEISGTRPTIVLDL